MDRRDFITTLALASTTLNSAEAAGITSPTNARTPNGLIKLAQAGPITSLPPMDQKDLAKLLGSVATMHLPNSLANPTPPNPTPEIPDILQPIDVGADELLKPFMLAPLIYSPMEVEYLVKALDDHISNCLNLREKAQQLEVLNIAQRLDLILEKKTIDFLTAMADFEKSSGSHIGSSMYNPTLVSNTIRSEEGDATTRYYNERRSIDETRIAARAEALQARLSRVIQSGSGSHYVERFDFIKAAFNRELSQAYRCAQSVVAGLRSVYGIDLVQAKKPLPPVTNIGYLSQLALWAKDIYYELERRLMKTTTLTIVVALRKGTDPNALPGLITDGDFVSQRTAGIFKAPLPAAFFDQPTLKLRNPRLRGLETYSWTDANPKVLDYTRIRVELPDQTIKDGTDTIWPNKPVVTFPLVTFPTGTEFSFETRREIYNCSPIGDWTLQIDKRTITDKDANKDDALRNIFLVMRVSAEVTS